MAKTLMVGSRFWTKMFKGWEEADPHGRSAGTTWSDATVEHQVNGAVPPERYADFLVVDGDPLRDTRELRKLTTVYRGGVAHDPQGILAHVPKSDAVQA